MFRRPRTPQPPPLASAEARLESECARSRALLELRARMQETLTGFKRDTVLEHKVRTMELAQEIAALADNQAVFAASMLWVYQGWSSVGSLAAEVRDPKTAYPRAMLALVAATVLTYALPVLYGVALQPDLDAWGEGSFGDLAAAVAPWLGVAMALGGVASNFAAGLNSFAMYSRFLQATAAEGYVPVAALARDDTTRFGTPVWAIALLTVSTLALANRDFDALLGVDTLFNAMSVVLVSASFVRLRIADPKLARPFSVPGGLGAAWLAAGATFALCSVSVVVAALSSWASVLVVGGVIAATYAVAACRERIAAKGGAAFDAASAGAGAAAAATATAGERTGLLGRVGRAYSVTALRAAANV